MYVTYTKFLAHTHDHYNNFWIVKPWSSYFVSLFLLLLIANVEEKWDDLFHLIDFV